jgi:diguanylate cyclase (GGDEF)-like protein/PAS domain S-box-containing protein
MEIGLDGRIRTANELALRVLGYSLHELWGRPHAMLVPEEDRNLPEYRDLWRRLARGEHAAGLFRRRGRRGRDVWLQVTCSPILDPNGQPWKFVEYATDVTDEVLRRADLQGQVDAIQRTQCTVEYDMAGRVISANDRFLALTGYRLEDIIGQPHRIFMLAGAAESADHARHWADLAAGQSASGEFRRRRKDGSTIWISGTYHPILDPRGKPVKIVQYCADATERVATQQALRDNELKLRGLFELSPAGIALLDEASGRILEANGALAALLGLPEELVVGRDFSDFLVGSAYATVLAGLHGGHAGERLESVEVSIRSPGGLPSAALLSGMRSIDPGGQRRVWAIVQDISQRKLAERELERAAMTDSLTGLANRPAFLRALEGAVARYRDDPTARYGVLLLDFDRFKFVNDTLGHAAGDQLLQHIGDRLRGRVRTGPRAGAGGRSGGIAARFGGDEFAVLVADLQADAEIEVITERLLKSLAEPYALLGRQIHSSASIGVFVASDPALTADEVMQQADLAMYEAKHRGRNRAARFDEGMQARLRRRLTLESDLRDAIEAGALTVAYQPIVDLQTGRIDGAEALVRWTHPTLGVISPAEFVPIAEDANLIVALGARVLQSACETFQHWRRTDPGRAPRRISVNMSRVELALGDAYIERLRSVLAETGMPAESLLLEVTEREIMRNPALSLELMKRLKAVGVRLAMDDFGTGASSLSCLRDYPFDIIKIDRSFLADLEAQQDVLMVLHATVTLVENLGMASVAEGIERPAQVAVLQTIGCRYGQGFLFSKAVPGDQFLAIDALHAWHDAAPAPTG